MGEICQSRALTIHVQVNINFVSTTVDRHFLKCVEQV